MTPSSPPPPAAGERVDTGSQPMDLVPPPEDAVWETASASYVGKENSFKAVSSDSGLGPVQRANLSRKNKVPLADQNVAFQKALQQSTGTSPSLRGGGKALGKSAEDDLTLAARKHAKSRKKKASKQRRKREREQQQERANHRMRSP
ncbi:MAG: hypothetical protein LQ338_000093 [Usnochroma carphineum]|nr:MAG: hypothetical protein LQ338_000093 [Usnochroma carphineum]